MSNKIFKESLKMELLNDVDATKEYHVGCYNGRISPIKNGWELPLLLIFQKSPGLLLDF